MIIAKEANNIVKSSLVKFNKLIAIFNNGSTVAGTAVPESDIDFVVIVKTENDIPKALSLLKKRIKFLGWDHEVPHFLFKGKRLAVSIYSKRRMDFFVNVLYKSKEDFLKWQKVLQHRVVEATPIFDPRKLLQEYKEKVNSYPERIRIGIFNDAMKDLREIYDEWGNYGYRNEFNFVFHLPTIMGAICLALYSKNKRLFMIPYKRLHKDLKELKPNIEKEFYFLIKGTHSKINREQKQIVLKKIIDKLQT